MISYLILCRTQSQAHRIAGLIVHSGHYATVMRPPAEISSGNCTFSVKVPERQIGDILALLKKSGIERGKIYVYRPDGSADETIY
jgi:hypothetical protein